MRIVDQIETEYNHVDVWQHGDGYDFEVAGGTHATYHTSRVLTGYAWDALTAASLLGPTPPRSILMLGLGGGTVARQLRHLLPAAQIVAVEIDPEMLRLASRYMALDDLGLEICIGDAYERVDQEERQFDVVIDDLYLGLGRDVSRPRPPTVELVKRLARRLVPGGLLAANVVDGHGHRQTVKAMEQAFRAVFPHRAIVTPPKGFNHTRVGSTDPLDPARLVPYAAEFTDGRDMREWQRTRVKLTDSC